MNLLELLDELLKYFNHPNLPVKDGLVWVLGSIMAYFIIAKLVVLTLNTSSNQQTKIKETSFLKIYKSFSWAYGITTLALVVTFCFYWSTDWYKDYPIEIFHLLSVFLLGVLFISSRINWKRKFSSNTINTFYNQPFTRVEAQDRVISGLTSYKKSKVIVLLPFLGFLSLLLLFSTSKVLISVVLDTSTSMEMANSIGEIPLESGKRSLIQTLEKLTEDQDLVFTIFSDGEPKNTVGAVVSSSEMNLLGQSQFFSGTQLNQAIQYIGNLNANISFSPITEVIWKNFLFTKQIAETEENYDQVVSIIITDGIESISEINFNEFFCSIAAYEELFANPERVNIISLNENPENEFFAKAQSCGYRIEDGFSESNYLISLNSIISNYTTNWNFLYILVLILIFPTLISLLITPKPR